jgi:hypothetical protein
VLCCGAVVHDFQRRFLHLATTMRTFPTFEFASVSIYGQFNGKRSKPGVDSRDGMCAMHRFSSDPKKPQLRRVRPIALPALSAPNDHFMGVCQTQNKRLGGSRFCVIIEATVMVIALIQYLPKSGFLCLNLFAFQKLVA